MSVPAQPGLEAVITTSTTSPPTGAQSPNPSPSSFAHGANGERTFTAADLARVRQEEKDKLYPELNSYKEQLNSIQQEMLTIRTEREANEKALREQQAAAEEAARLQREAEMTARELVEQKLKENNDTWESRFTALQTERDTERALAQKEREYNELVDYRTSRIAETANDIAPQFHNFITGETREQIDAAIEAAKAATQSIFEQVQGAQQAQPPRGVSPTGYTAFGPLDGNLGQQQITPADINKMSMAQFAEFRDKSGMSARDAARNRGLFG